METFKCLPTMYVEMETGRLIDPYTTLFDIHEKIKTSQKRGNVVIMQWIIKCTNVRDREVQLELF